MPPQARIQARENGRDREGAYPDEICRRCGRCCREKLMVDGKIYVLPGYCAYWDRETKLCTIYERRNELNPNCLDVATGLQLGVFPADCPYVEGVEGYTPPIEGVVDEQILREIDEGLIRTAEEFEARVKAGTETGETRQPRERG